MKNVIIFDFNRTLYNPETQALMPSALFLLHALQGRGHKLHLISRKENNREDLVKNLGIAKYFSDVAFFDEKTKEVFRAFMEKNAIEANECFIVGDRVRKEIAIGNALGVKTIWFQNGKFTKELPRCKEEEPRFPVANLKEILTIVP